MVEAEAVLKKDGKGKKWYAGRGLLGLPVCISTVEEVERSEEEKE